MKYIYVIYALLIFVALFLIVLPFVLVFSLFGNRGRRASWFAVRIWAYIWFALVGIFNRNIYEAQPQRGRNYIVVANHYSYLDTPVIFRAISFFVRPLATYEYSKIPLFGYLYKHLAVIIDRGNMQSKSDGVKILRQTLNEGSSIFIFPEGRFNKTGKMLNEFYDGAFKIAIQTHTPILPLLFLDTNERWNNMSFWSFKPGKNRVVFLPEIDPAAYDGNVKALKEKVHQEMEFYLKKYQDFK
ncbi:MAG: hypothetical protein BGO31_04570 [Bacteroidetes bacterium 43-16]|nr:MAG: hypothetical protein BGO31_04570 [Bacteroidetes bacterium 43-16]